MGPLVYSEGVLLVSIPLSSVPTRVPGFPLKEDPVKLDVLVPGSFPSSDG